MPTSIPLQQIEGSTRILPTAGAPAPGFDNISFLSIIFLDMAASAPYIGPVNARTAPAATGPCPGPAGRSP